jgi:hypothetical protein
MLIGYVSDDRYLALPDVLLEFRHDALSVEARSRASGAVYADLPSGPYTVALYRPGFGPKRVGMTVTKGVPHHFRLLPDSLLGYAWPKWVQAGGRSEFRVHSPEAYRLQLWRYGYKKEMIRTLGWFDEHGPRATVQISPDGDYTQTGIEWNKHGYANPVHLQYCNAPERSGLYCFHAKTASGLAFSFPWIVAPAKPQSKIAVLASNITWNAYNNFGGRSNYIHPDRLPPTPTINARLELHRYTDRDHINYAADFYAPLSFDRPEPINSIAEREEIYNPIEGRAACHLAAAEWRLLGWLEREGFSYDLWAETQLHSGPLNLDDYKVLILNTHPEYWSKAMYQSVKAWVNDRGGKLMYLGGNGMNCLVEFTDPYTVLYDNGNGLELKRRSLESRTHLKLESEASLLGAVFTEAGAMTGAPYRVVEGRHWVFEGTGLKDGDIFGRESLHMRCPGGASGHETDKISPSSPKNVKQLAKGMNVNDGGADMLCYDTPSGGAVFSASSICWTSSILVDEGVSKATANVLRRFLG